MDEKPVILALDNVEPLAVVPKLETLFRLREAERLIGRLKINDVAHAPKKEVMFSMLRCQFPQLKIFLDLKLPDVSETNLNILRWYAEYEIAMVTVSAGIVSAQSFIRLHKEFPDIELIAYCVPTDMPRMEVYRRFGRFPEMVIMDMIGGLEHEFEVRFEGNNPVVSYVCGGPELSKLKERFGSRYSPVVPALRSSFMEKDHQERTTPPRVALEQGAKWLVMGSQLLRGNPEKGISPEESLLRTYDEIFS